MAPLRQKTDLGRLEIQALAFAQSARQEILRTGDLQDGIGLRPIQERNLLSRMATAGVIVRLSRGIYLMPQRLPPGGRFAAGTFQILTRLMEAISGRYQVGGPNAFHAYGFDDQVPNLTYVFNNRLSGQRCIGGAEFVFIEVKESRLGSADRLELSDGVAYLMASKARTLLDAVQYWSRFGTLPSAYGWIADAVAVEPGLAGDLVGCALTYGSSMASRRLGVCLEEAGVPPKTLAPLRARYRGVSTRIAYIPGRPARGRVISAWGVIRNE